MAARVLLRRRSMAPWATAAAFAGMALVPATVLAEAPSAAVQVNKLRLLETPLLTRPQRKPIYDDPDTPMSNLASQTSSSTSSSPPPITSAPRKLLASFSPDPAEQPQDEPGPPRGPTPTDRLAVQVGHARLFLYRCAVAAEDRVNATMDSALNLEQSFTNTIASLAPPRESGERLMPGAIYVLVAAMAGSIVARNRNIVVRASLPLALGVAAGWVVVPLTMRNVSDLAWTYEKRFPAVADTHIRLREGVERGVSFAKVHSQLGVRYVDKVTEARETIETWVKQGK